MYNLVYLLTCIYVFPVSVFILQGNYIFRHNYYLFFIQSLVIMKCYKVSIYFSFFLFFYTILQNHKNIYSTVWKASKIFDTLLQYFYFHNLILLCKWSMYPLIKYHHCAKSYVNKRIATIFYNLVIDVWADCLHFHIITIIRRFNWSENLNPIEIFLLDIIILSQCKM